MKLLFLALVLLAGPLRAQDTLTLEYGQKVLILADTIQPAWPQEPEPVEPEPEPVPPITPSRPLARVGLFAYALPISEIGVIFTSAVEVVTKDLPEKCDAAAARGGMLIGSQGTYAKFIAPNRQTGKLEYKPALMDQWIKSHRPYIKELVKRQKLGSLGPIQIADDFASNERWPPVGLSVKELSRIAAIWHTLDSEIELALRARPRQFTGEVPQGVTVFIVQFRYWGLNDETPTQFRDKELALADARGWDIIWSMNFQDGGGMKNGVKRPMSSQQIKEAGLTFAAIKKRNRGLGGWKYEKSFMSKAGMPEAFRALAEAVR